MFLDIKVVYLHQEKLRDYDENGQHHPDHKRHPRVIT